MTGPDVKLKHRGIKVVKCFHNQRGLDQETIALRLCSLFWLGRIQTLKNGCAGWGSALYKLTAATCSAKASEACKNIFSRGTTFFGNSMFCWVDKTGAPGLLLGWVPTQCEGKRRQKAVPPWALWVMPVLLASLGTGGNPLEIALFIFH